MNPTNPNADFCIECCAGCRPRSCAQSDLLILRANRENELKPRLRAWNSSKWVAYNRLPTRFYIIGATKLPHWHTITHTGDLIVREFALAGGSNDLRQYLTDVYRMAGN